MFRVIPMYVLDACAIIAVAAKERGWDAVMRLYADAAAGRANLCMHKLNLLEVYYAVTRKYDRATAEKTIREIVLSPVQIFDRISERMFENAGRLKTAYRISLADSIALAETLEHSCSSLVTADHHEFDPLVGKEAVQFHWFR